MNTILQCRKDGGPVAVHPEKASGFHILLGQAVDLNCNVFLILPRDKFGTYRKFRVRWHANKAHLKACSSLRKLTLQLLAQLPELPHQILLRGGSSLSLRLPNVRMAPNVKDLLIQDTDVIAKKGKLRCIIQRW